jgi:hypothetical protein
MNRYELAGLSARYLLGNALNKLVPLIRDEYNLFF